MRQRKTKPWEVEAQEATEDLRLTLADLDQREQLLAASGVVDPSLYGALSGAADVTKNVRSWLPDWDRRAEKAASSDSLAYLVYRSCVPALLVGVEVFTSALGILVSSPEVAEVDRELASQAIAATIEPISLALDLLGDASVLRTRDRPVVFDAVVELRELTAPLLELAGPLLARRRELGKHVRPDD